MNDDSASTNPTVAHAKSVLAKLQTLRDAMDGSVMALAQQAERDDDDDLRDIAYDLARGSGIEGLTRRVCGVWGMSRPQYTARRQHRPLNTPMPGDVIKGSFPLRNPASVLPQPKTPCVYVLLDAAGSICYVGRSTNVRLRLKDHQNDPNKPDLATWHVHVCRSDEWMFDLEAILIAQHRPYYNRKAETRNGAAA